MRNRRRNPTDETRRRSARVLLAGAVGLGLAGPASSLDFFWDAQPPSTAWNNPFNWEQQTVPSGGQGNNAFITNGGFAEIQTTIQDVGNIIVGGSRFAPSTLSHVGGSTVPPGGTFLGSVVIGPSDQKGFYTMSGIARQEKALMEIGTANDQGLPGGEGTLMMFGESAVVSQQIIAGRLGNANGLSVGIIEMYEGASISTSEWLRLNNGSMSMDDSTLLMVGSDFWVASGNGRGAQFSMDGFSQAEVMGDIRIGRDNSEGNVNLSGSAQLTKLAEAGTYISVGSSSQTGGGVLNISDSAALISASNLVLSESPGTTGIVNQSGGTVDLRDSTTLLGFNDSLEVDAAGNGLGEYHLSGGLLKTQTLDASTGLFDFTGGTLKVSKLFRGDLNQDGGIFAPGASPADVEIEGDYNLNAEGGTLLLEIAGTNPGSEYDTLLITGDVNLSGGTFEADLLNGFTPERGDSFDFLTWWGTLTGAFDTFDLPSLTPGLTWDTGDVLTNGVLSVTMMGDTDGDGDVDDADLGTMFVNFTGPIGMAGGKSAAQGDTNWDGDVDDGDLANAFAGFTGPAAPLLAVPEPATVTLMIGGVLIGLRRRRSA